MTEREEMPWPTHPRVFPCHQLYIKGAKLLEVAKPSPRASRSTLQVHVTWQRKRQMHAQSSVLSIKRRLQHCARATTYLQPHDEREGDPCGCLRAVQPPEHVSIGSHGHVSPVLVWNNALSRGKKQCATQRQQDSEDGHFPVTWRLNLPLSVYVPGCCSQLYECYLIDELRKGLGGRLT